MEEGVFDMSLNFLVNPKSHSYIAQSCISLHSHPSLYIYVVDREKEIENSKNESIQLYEKNQRQDYLPLYAHSRLEECLMASNRNK